MQKLWLSFILTFTILFSAEYGTVYGLDSYGDGFLSLRTQPNSTEISRLYNGNKVKILNKRGKWYRVKDIRLGKIGWSHSNWIKITHTSSPQKSSKNITYYAKISSQDHYNAKSGKRITQLAYIIQQDRANYHKYHKRDSEDTNDNLFDTINNRKKIAAMIRRGSISAKLRDEILYETPYIKVTVRGNRMYVSSVQENDINTDSSVTNKNYTSYRIPNFFSRCAACHGTKGHIKALGMSSIIGGKDNKVLIQKIKKCKNNLDIVNVDVRDLVKLQSASLSEKDIIDVANYLSILDP